jgi:hypothetical protein
MNLIVYYVCGSVEKKKSTEGFVLPCTVESVCLSCLPERMKECSQNVSNTLTFWAPSWGNCWYVRIMYVVEGRSTVRASSQIHVIFDEHTVDFIFIDCM